MTAGRRPASQAAERRRVAARRRSARRFVGMAIAAFVIGPAAGLAGGAALGPAVGIALGVGAGWAAASIEFIVAVWLTVGRFSAEQTREHATAEDPGRATSDTLCVTACFVAVLAVLALLVLTPNVRGVAPGFIAVTAVLTVSASWSLIHVIYMLRYARVYYAPPVGGIDFNTTDPPAYTDFAYVAFDLGMTYQISDTAVATRELRGIVLRHTLLSYVFGVGILASVINLVVSL